MISFAEIGFLREMACLSLLMYISVTISIDLSLTENEYREQFFFRASVNRRMSYVFYLFYREARHYHDECRRDH